MGKPKVQLREMFWDRTQFFMGNKDNFPFTLKGTGGQQSNCWAVLRQWCTSTCAHYRVNTHCPQPVLRHPCAQQAAAGEDVSSIFFASC